MRPQMIPDLIRHISLAIDDVAGSIGRTEESGRILLQLDCLAASSWSVVSFHEETSRRRHSLIAVLRGPSEAKLRPGSLSPHPSPSGGKLSASSACTVQASYPTN